jgi:hypothetical protein
MAGLFSAKQFFAVASCLRSRFWSRCLRVLAIAMRPFHIEVLEIGTHGTKLWWGLYEAELTSMLNFMELLGDPPTDFVSTLRWITETLLSGASSFESSCRHTWYSSGLRSSPTVPCPPCCRPSSLRTLYPLRWICGQTGYASKSLERREPALQQMSTRPMKGCLPFGAPFACSRSERK